MNKLEKAILAHKTVVVVDVLHELSREYPRFSQLLRKTAHELMDEVVKVLYQESSKEKK